MNDRVVRIVGVDGLSGKTVRLLDDGTTGWVFADPSGPAASFEVGESSRRSGRSVDGSVSWTATAAGCRWPMAKCRVSSKALAATIP